MRTMFVKDQEQPMFCEKFTFTLITMKHKKK